MVQGPGKPHTIHYYVQRFTHSSTHALYAAAGVAGQSAMHAVREPPGQPVGVGPGGVGPGAVEGEGVKVEGALKWVGGC